ncbi:MAG TPA: hypothetical protein VKA23_00935 [Mariprofundaceae bacterium]|nr:hypothetical protein [Mariprofundaceae bacterium]
MVRLVQSLAAWGTPEFKTVLKQEIEAFDIAQLPLVAAMTGGSVPLEGSVEAVIRNVSEDDLCIHVRAGIFFKSIIAGCACANDPTPENENNEYCDIELMIDKETAESDIVMSQA